jgi:hypothetical protein
MPYRHDDARERERARLAAELSDLRDEPRSLERAAREAEIAAAIRGLFPTRARGLPAMRLLPRLRIASPCGEDWNAMVGDARVRRCSRCEKDVFDLSAMTADEAEALLTAHLASPEGMPCVRLYRRSDGTILTSDCVDGTGARRVAQAVAAAAMLAGTAATASALAPEERPPHHVHYAPPRIEAPPQPEPLSESDWTGEVGGSMVAPALEALMGDPAISAEELFRQLDEEPERPRATQRASTSRRRRRATR